MRMYLSKRSVAERMALVVCLLLFVSSCVTDKEFLYLNDQIVALNKRVDGIQEVSKELASIRERQATADAELHKIREDMQAVSGRLEENNRLVMRAIERDTTAQDDMSTTVASLSERVSKMETGIRRLFTYLNLEPVAAAQAPGSEEKPLIASEPAPEPQVPQPRQPVPAVEKSDASPEQRLYDVTLALYREEQYEEAIAGFKNFVEKYPKSDLADNAQFWVGESYMSLKQYEQAILAFQRVIKDYPKGNKVANATLRQAVAFYEINDKTSSKLLLKKLIKQFPKSTEAKIAEAKLNTMK